VIGSDVLVLDADSRISRVHGFLDKVPALSRSPEVTH
jgi:hypothetical protein